MDPGSSLGMTLRDRSERFQRLYQTLRMGLQHFAGRLFAWPGQGDTVVCMARHHMHVEVEHRLLAFFAIGLQQGQAGRVKGR